MSLYDMDTDTTNNLPSEHLHNAVLNYIIAGLQAIDWEPTGRTSGGRQIMSKGGRSFMVEVTMLDEVRHG